MNADDAGKAVFRLEIVVPESTIDANGHVNNVHYVQWMQNAAEAHSAALWAEAWREVGLAVAVLWAVLGGACFFTGAQWVYDSWGTSLNAALIIDAIFLAGVLVVIGFVWWRQRLHGEGLRELGWGRPTRGAAVAVAVVYGLAWVVPPTEKARGLNVSSSLHPQ